MAKFHHLKEIIDCEIDSHRVKPAETRKRDELHVRAAKPPSLGDKIIDEITLWKTARQIVISGGHFE
jgi:hypothetical protein